jgi:hypothetical protein
MSGPQGDGTGRMGFSTRPFFIITLGYQAMGYVIRMALMGLGI